MASPARPPITCHVLDTTTGLPASSIPVTLTPLSPTTSSTPFTATTNSDGRVTAWQTQPSSPSLSDLFANNTSARAWSLIFDIGGYYEAKGIKSFWPDVEIRFVTRPEDAKEHYHVPLLVGPFSYTAYRGS